MCVEHLLPGNSFAVQDADFRSVLGDGVIFTLMTEDAASELDPVAWTLIR